MEWVRTLFWLARGNAAGLLVFLVLVAAAYAFVPLETPPAGAGQIELR